jgi:transcriptional regulator with XRE-family HTH domain
MSLKALGERLKLAREAARLTQRQVADHFGVVVATISRWETGAVDPGHERLAVLAGLYDVEPGRLAYPRADAPKRRRPTRRAA